MRISKNLFFPRRQTFVEVFEWTNRLWFRFLWNSFLLQSKTEIPAQRALSIILAVISNDNFTRNKTNYSVQTEHMRILFTIVWKPNVFANPNNNNWMRKERKRDGEKDTHKRKSQKIFVSLWACTNMTNK